MVKITFEKANITHKDILFSWLAEPHIQEFWDNTPEHKEDILKFMDGRKELSSYCDGKYVYWIASLNGTPFALLMTIQETPQDDIDDLKLSHLSKTGHTYGLDYMIGNPDYFGKGYGAQTLSDFMNFFRTIADVKADTFLIDPASDNPRAKRVYEKTGFVHLGDFVMGGNYSGSGKKHHLLIKKFSPTPNLEPAKLDDYTIIQNMARFYKHALSKECTHISNESQQTTNDLAESLDFKNYFEEECRRAYLIKIYGEIVGFALLNQATTGPSSNWNIGEFFILGPYQKQNIGQQAAENLWRLIPGQWEVSVMPENLSALTFWEKTIKKFTDNHFTKETKLIDFDKNQPKRVIFTFQSVSSSKTL